MVVELREGCGPNFCRVGFRQDALRGPMTQGDGALTCEQRIIRSLANIIVGASEYIQVTMRL